MNVLPIVLPPVIELVAWVAKKLIDQAARKPDVKAKLTPATQAWIDAGKGKEAP